jgi:hypothetical protein
MASASSLSLVIACNQILGNEDGRLGAGGALSTAGGDGGSGGQSETASGGRAGENDGGAATSAGEGGAEPYGGEGGAATSSGEGGAATSSGGGGAATSGGSSAAGRGGSGGAERGGQGAGGGELCASPCELPHAEASCVAGACTIMACSGPWRDANGAAADGCETGDAPTDALSLWFMGDRGITASGALVSGWADQSPAHQDAVQTTESLMPKQVASGALTLVEFDGKDDGLRLPTGFANFSAGTSFFAVVEALPSTRCEGILSLSNGDDTDDIEYERDSQQALYYEVLADWVQGSLAAFEANRRLLLTVIQAPDGSVDARLNRVRSGSGKIGLPANVTRTQNYVGKNTYDECPTSFTGRIGELLFYGRGVSAAERDRVESYLVEKWEVP